MFTVVRETVWLEPDKDVALIALIREIGIRRLARLTVSSATFISSFLKGKTGMSAQNFAFMMREVELQRVDIRAAKGEAGRTEAGR